MHLSITNQLTEIKRHNIYLIQSAVENQIDTLHALEAEGIQIIDIGKSLSATLVTHKITKYLHLDAEEQLRSLIENNEKKIDPSKPPVAAIYNLGILLEPAISIDAAKIIKELSKTTAIIIIWDGHCDSSGVLHWNEQIDTSQFDFSEAHLKQLNISHEI